MRFKLVENRIDDLKRMIAIDISNRKIEKEIIQYTDHIGLLSIEEAEKIDDDVNSGLLEKNILKWPKDTAYWWWLRSPGYYSNIAAYVSSDGSVYYYGNYVDGAHVCVRPALYLKFKILATYKNYIVYGEPWIAISEDTLLYNGSKLIEHRFDDKTNVYENSEIKQFVENEWLNKIRSM